MFLRVAPFLAMLITLLLLAACDTGTSSMPTPRPEYLTEEIPPCVPVPGSLADPCEPGALPLSGGGLGYAGYEPHGLRHYMELTSVHVAHLVLRGAYLPGTVRCKDNRVRFRHPPYTDFE